jgi:hypothetical protein
VTARAWTIQRVEWWHVLQQRGLCGDGRRGPPGFRQAYRWIMGQMSRRLPAYRGGFPVWMWLQPRPDLRRAAHLRRGRPGVLLELQIPSDCLLPLDFETWHCVLNRWHLSMSESESMPGMPARNRITRIAPACRHRSKKSSRPPGSASSIWRRCAARDTGPRLTASRAAPNSSASMKSGA